MLLHGDALDQLKTIEDNTIDSIVTDPPYGYSFMNKDWDKIVVSVDIWKECLRVLKSGAFAFIMCAPRQDVLSRQIVNLQNAGFETGFTSIYWTYASGFPKAADVSKLVDKRYDEKKRRSEYYELAEYLKQSRENKKISAKKLTELFPSRTGGITGCVWNWENGVNIPTQEQYNILKIELDLDDRFDWLIEQETKRFDTVKETRSRIQSTGNLHKNDLTHGWSTMSKKSEYLMLDDNAVMEQAKALDGAYAGFQPKPAVEVVLVVMKPLSEKSYVDQALKNGHGITWLDSARIPYQDNNDMKIHKHNVTANNRTESNRFVNTYSVSKSRQIVEQNQSGRFPANLLVTDDVLNDDHSRYFDLDKWFETTFPFAIIPKPSKAEKNMGLDKWIPKKVNDGRKTEIDNPFQRGETPRQNTHATVKPIKLMSYLIMLGSRENDIVLDPFCGSGTTLIAAQQLKRKWIGIEINKDYINIAEARLNKCQKY